MRVYGSSAEVAVGLSEVPAAKLDVIEILRAAVSQAWRSCSFPERLLATMLLEAAAEFQLAA